MLKDSNFTMFLSQLKSRQDDEYRNLEEDFRQRRQRLHEAHEQEIQNCIRRYFTKHQDQPEDLSLHRHASSSDVYQNLVQQHQPLVTLASPNFLMPPAPPQSQSSHSSTEDCSGISYAVKHKLQVISRFFSSNSKLIKYFYYRSIC